MSEFKERLITALHSAVSSFNETNDPNASVIKAAQDNDFNVDQTTRLVETFNTARTIYHYKSAGDRTEPFSLADSSVVIPAMFKSLPDTKKAVSADHDYSDYDLREVDYRGQMIIKAADGLNEDAAVVSREYHDISMDTLSDRAMDIVHVNRDLASTARDEASMCGNKAAEALNKLASAISLGYEDVCQDQYNRLMAGYLTEASPLTKEQYGPVMSKLASFVPAWLDTGSRGIKLGSVIDDRDLSKYIMLVKEAKHWLEEEASMLAIADQLDKEATAFEEEWYAAAGIVEEKQAEVKSELSDLVKVSQTLPKTDNPDKVQSTPDKKKYEPGMILSGLSKGISGGIGGATTDTISSGLNQMLSGPAERENKALSDELKNVQRQLVLEDLMVTDPVLSEEPPHKILAAYKALLSLSPEVAANKEVVRAILRQSVHSMAISPYEAQTWTDLEKTIQQVTGKSPATAMPAKGVKK